LGLFKSTKVFLPILIWFELQVGKLGSLENIVKIIKKEDASTAVTLKDKIIELGNYLYKEKTGRLHKTIMEIAEKPLIEYVLERVEGNQIKAAKILGLNRNTIRAKIAKLSINVNKWKAL